MALTINHAYTATGTYAHDGEMNKDVWNAALNYSGVLDVANGGTGVTASTGSGSAVLNTAPALSAITLSVAAAVTAGTNSQGQGALTSDINVITTTASNPSGVTLPSATTGRFVVQVVNKGTNSIIVYPASGSKIDALSTNSGIQIKANASLFFLATSSTQWYSSSNNAANLSLAIGTASAQNGGTGQSSYTTGDLLYANGSFSLGKLAAGTAGQVLTSNGAAAPVWSSNILSTSGVIGYNTGAGGTVTQATSRTTGVTLNKASGAITLFTAAGSATATTFTVTNSTVTANDTIIVCQKSGTNLYNILVTAVGTGTFDVTFYTTGGTASDAPVFNFNVIRGINA